MPRNSLVLSLAIAFAVQTDPSTGARADWPQYRRDAARSGFTPDPVPASVEAQWRYRAVQAPVRAWPRSQRLTFDRVYRPVVAGGRVFFGSSADGAIRALDAATGEEIWSELTDGPIRLAPVAWKDRVIVGSDDGFVYSFHASDGTLAWKRRLGASRDFVLGNERLVSRAPVRGGAVLVGDELYIAAGIWPTEGVTVACLDAASGAVNWANDSLGTLFMAQPHGGANARSGVAAQGHLAATDDALFIPTGRAVPAALARTNGDLRYFHLQKYGNRGGAGITIAGPWFFNGGRPYTIDAGLAEKEPAGGHVVALPDGIARFDRGRLTTYRWTMRELVDRKGNQREVPALSPTRVVDPSEAAEPLELTAHEFVVAADTAIVGGAGLVVGIDLATGAERWRHDIDGAVAGLAVSAGRIFASTDRGEIVCLGAADSAPAEGATIVSPERDEAPYGENDIAARAASEILAATQVKRGYCVDLGSGDGALAYEFAKRSDLRIYAVEPDPELAATARDKLARAGLYGTRVTVHELPLDATRYPSMFANLVVSRRGLETTVADRSSVSEPPGGELLRLVRPYGGAVVSGSVGAVKVHRRGALEGDGEWTHQYADPANTVCSDDTLLEGDLALGWYRDVDQAVPQRHGRAPAPLVSGGRIFSEGLDSLVAVDAYNGTVLWRYPLPGILRAYDGDHLMGAAGSGSNFCIGGDSVYVREGDHCLRIDAATGQLQSRFALRASGEPSAGRTWGYVAASGDTLFGSEANPEHVVTYRYLKGGDLRGQLTESRRLFALDRRSGSLRWKYDARESIRHNAIAIGAGRVHLIDRALAMFDRRRKSTGSQPPGDLVALDVVTGAELWRKSGAFGTVLALSTEHDALVMSYQNTRFKLASELDKKVRVYRASTGDLLWEKDDAAYESRPLIVEQTLYSQGGAWDLLTGEPKVFRFSRSYGCGQLAAGRHLLVYRSATLGYFDLKYNTENKDFGGMRPGCWINAIPAHGMVLVPDASAGCVCSYLNRSWIALRPRRTP